MSRLFARILVLINQAIWFIGSFMWHVTNYHVATIEYLVNSSTTEEGLSLVDRGANGGVLGSEGQVLRTYMRTVNITGVEDHRINSIPIVDAYAKIQTHAGPAVGIFRQYAHLGKGRTIHSSPQIEHYKNTVHDRSRKVGGKQCIRTNDGYIIPLDIVQGLPYMRLEHCSDQEFNELPHVIFTASDRWDPKVLDHKISDAVDWASEIPDITPELIQTPFVEFDKFGNYTKRNPGPPGTTSDAPALDDHEKLHAELKSDDVSVNSNSSEETATTAFMSEYEREDVEFH